LGRGRPSGLSPYRHRALGGMWGLYMFRGFFNTPERGNLSRVPQMSPISGEPCKCGPVPRTESTFPNLAVGVPQPLPVLGVDRRQAKSLLIHYLSGFRRGQESFLTAFMPFSTATSCGPGSGSRWPRRCGECRSGWSPPNRQSSGRPSRCDHTPAPTTPAW